MPASGIKENSEFLTTPFITTRGHQTQNNLKWLLLTLQHVLVATRSVCAKMAIQNVFFHS